MIEVASNIQTIDNLSAMFRTLFVTVYICCSIEYVLSTRDFALSTSKKHEYSRITLFNHQTPHDGFTLPIQTSLHRKFESELRQAINPSLFNYVTIHGYSTGYENDWAFELKDKILSVHNANVFVVEWFIRYDNLFNVSLIAKLISDFFNSLHLSRQQFEKMHFIGHSIGVTIANTAVIAMKHKVGHLTGLDPYTKEIDLMWHPKYDANRAEESTYKFIHCARFTEASFSLIIHTDMNNLGMFHGCGNIDIFLNGGSNQPGSESDIRNDSHSKTNYNHDFAARFFKSIATYQIAKADNLNSSLQASIFESEINKCFSVAFLCYRFTSFMAGHCGICPERSVEKPLAQCVHAGLPGASVNYSTDVPMRTNPYLNTFYTVTDSQADCLFTYRILVGIEKNEVRRLRSLTRDDKAFVRIPLSEAPNHSKTIELSAEFPDQFMINKAFVREFRSVRENLHFDEETLSNLNFRSILVTFKSKISASVDLSSEELDEPLIDISLVDVWGENIKAVQFVAIDYMSHPDFVIRKKHSYFLTRNEIDREDTEFSNIFDYHATFSNK